MADEKKETTGATASEETPKKKKFDWKGKRLPIIVVAVCLVTVVGVAGWAWHATPGMCSMICHDTMGKYYETYQNDSSTLAWKHRAATNNHCLGCHEATLPQMLHEVEMTIAGTYKVPFDKVTFSNDFCLQSGCHTGAGVMPGATESSTAGWSFDPHSTKHGVQQCNSCHLMHDQSVFTCAGCHYTYEAPESWTQEVTVDGNTIKIPEGWTVPQNFQQTKTEGVADRNLDK